MPAPWILKSPDDQTSKDRFGAILAMTFHMSSEEVGEYFDRVGVSNLRVVSKGTRVVGGLALVPMGQWFGGRVVPCVGVTSVCIQPHHRSRGAGRHLIQESLNEMHRDGWALSVLYPVTQPGYRRMGYEHAGSLWDMRMPLDRIRVKQRDLDVREITAADESATVELYRKRAALHNGQLERNAALWKDVRQSDEGETHGYAVVNGDTIEAYVYYVHSQSDEAFYTLQATDLVVGTADAGRRLLSFLADHRSMADQVRWRGTPHDWLLTLLREQIYKARLKSHWMMRIIDARKALAQRGYPKGVSATLHFDIRDDVLPANNARITLHVDDGNATVSEGGHGNITIDIRGLASLFASHQTPAQLAIHGYLAAPPEVIATLATVFAGPPPWMADHF